MKTREAIIFITPVLFMLAACSSTGKNPFAGLGEYKPLTGNNMSGNEYRKDNIAVEKSGGHLLIHAGSVRINYNLDSGIAEIFRPDLDTPVFTDVFTETELNKKRIGSGSLHRSDDSVFLEEINDPFGAGVKISVKNTDEDNLIIWQNFYAYQTKSYLILEAVIESPNGIITNYIAPIAAGSGGTKNVVSLGDAEDARFLFVPYDNDGFIRYRADKLMGASESYGVTSVFDNVSRKGLVTGAVTHDLWKTGIRVKTGIGRGNNIPIIDFRIFGGITSGTTRDVPYESVLSPHGSLKGYQVYSPKIFLGFYDDWRDGMEEFGRANGIANPPLPWDQGPPFGWNSWSAVADKVNYEIYVTASDFLRKELPDFSNHKGVVYINFDSFWDNLNEAQRREAAAYVRKNGHRPGIYHTPFTCWHGDEDSLRAYDADTTGYKWYDLVLKDSRRRPIRYMNGTGYALDPTHPGTIALNNLRMNQFKEWGFEYVKLDFLSHGAMEGVYYDKSITTGVQAYNYGMKKLLEAVDDDIKNQKFFVSLSIAPMFPSQYAHGRRISCDVFGDINNSEYMLNSLTYGWWMNQTVYPYNDPDHLAVYNSFNHPEPHMFNEGLTSYISKVIAGAFLIDSDDIRIPEAGTRVKQILSNEEVNKLAADGISFRPVEGNTGDRAADIFSRCDKEEGVWYLALFNFMKNTKTMIVDFDRIGLEAGTWYVRDMITHKDEAPVTAMTMTVNLEPAEPKLFKLYR